MKQLCLRGDRRPVLSHPSMGLTLTLTLTRPILSHPSMGDMLVLYLREEEAGYAIVGENLATFPIRVEVDASEGTCGFISSRGALFCQAAARIPVATCCTPSPSLRLLTLTTHPQPLPLLPGSCTHPGLPSLHPLARTHTLTLITPPHSTLATAPYPPPSSARTSCRHARASCCSCSPST